MTVGIVTPYYPDAHTTNSGIANHYSVLSESLPALGDKVVIIHVRPAYEGETGRFNKQDSGNKIVLTYKIALSPFLRQLFSKRWSVNDAVLKLKCMLFTARNLNSIIRQYHIDVIETTSYFSLCYFCRSAVVPVTVRVSTTFYQILSDYYPFKSKLLNVIARFEIRMIRRSKNLITHSQSHAIELAAKYDLNADRFTIIPHGIHLPEKIDFTHSSNVILNILYVGRLEPRKGIDVLLEAIPQLLKKFPNIQFDIVGSDPGNKYENLFLQKNKSVNVNFRGHLDEEAIKEAYQHCDIFVAPSRYESFGLIYIEAMSYSKPVIGCRAGGVLDVIEHGYNGLLCEPGDVESLVTQITYLINNEAARLTMGNNGRLTAEHKFSNKVLAENSHAYFQKLLS